MYTPKIRKFLVIALVVAWAGTGVYLIARLKKSVQPAGEKTIAAARESGALDKALDLLRFRKDNDALVIFEKALAEQPDNVDALWGKAEVLRRKRSYKEAENIFNEILKRDPNHVPSMLGLGFIKYKDDKLKDAQKLANRALETRGIDKEDQALAFILIGLINSRRCQMGGFWNKIRFGTQIKHNFLKAERLAPDSPEMHLSLGTFYLLAPPIIGGNLDKAIEELEITVKLTPDFATANARLAQAYSLKGDMAKYSIYILRAKELDPENEVLKELKS